jgi:hypothetical protein
MFARAILVVLVSVLSASAADPPAIVWTDASKDTAKIGDISVKLESAKIYGPDAAKKRHSPAGGVPYLEIELLITNNSDTKKINYSKWSFRPVKVEDDLGNIYKNQLRTDGGGPGATDRQRGGSLYPEKSLKDILIYEMPVEKATAIFVTLPASSVGQTGSYYLKIPSTSMKKP